MEWIAQIEKTVQVSEDSWRVMRLTLKLNPDTTIQQINDWVKSKDIGMIKVELYEMESLGLASPPQTNNNAMQSKEVIIAKTGEDRYCLVKPPDDAFNFYILPSANGKPEQGLFWKNGKPSPPWIILPPGNWIIVGIGKDLKEEQWKGIIEKGKDGICYKYYLPGDYLSTTSTESGFSWLRSHGADETFLILKEVK